MTTAEAILDTMTTTSRLAAVAATLETVCLRVMRQGEASPEYRAVIGCHLIEALRLARELGIPVEDVTRCK